MLNMKNKIAIIIPYFGTFPIWIDLFLYSCSKNDFIDFLIYTDCAIPSRVYSNTRFYNISFDEYCRRVSFRLGIDFHPRTPYKLCDLKPFYGYIHADDILPYEFWGFGDMDLIYGDMRLVLSDDKLSRYDLITTHADRVAGHFTVIRKNSDVDRAVFRIKDWQNRIESHEIYGVDEHDFTDLIYPLMPKLRWIYRHFVKSMGVHLYDFLAIFNYINNLVSRKYIKEFYTSEIPKDLESWQYNVEEGKIINPRNKEIPYLHFLFFKKTPFIKQSVYWAGDFYDLSSLNYDFPDGYVTITNKRVTHNV